MTNAFRTVALGTLLLLSCASADSGSLLISEDQEIQMGGEYNSQLLQEMPVYTGDVRVNNYVTQVGNALAVNSGRPTLPYHFTVIDSQEINAFAVMGGYVYVTTGLLRASGSGAEVATIVAHELGHVSARHGVRAMETYMIEKGLTGLLFQGDQTRQLVEGALSTLSLLTFSKDQEREADSLGVQYAAATQWNPWGIIDFFEYLEDARGGPSSGGVLSQIGELFSTHPANPERIANVTAELEGMGITKDDPDYRKGLPSEDSGFAAMKAALGG